MVSGIGSASSGNNFSSGSFRGDGVFSVANENPRNLLQLDPVFRQPSTELREAEEIRSKDNALLNSKDTNRSPSRNSNQGPLENKSPDPLANPISVEPQLGKSVSRLAVENSPEGGSDLSAKGKLTFSSGDREITVSEGDNARIIRNTNGSITIENQTTETSQTFQPGQTLSIEGQGEASISGFRETTLEAGTNTATRQTTSQLTFSAGEGIEITGRRGAALRRPASAESIAIASNDPTAIAIAGGSGEEFLFTNNAGQAIQFEAGQTGSISRNDDGSVTITNSDTGVSETFSSETELSTGGKATARLRNSAGERLDFEGQDQGRFQTNEKGGLELVNRATEERIGIQPVMEPPQPERPLQFQTFSNPNTEVQQALQEELIRRPDEEARQRAEEAEETESDEDNEDSETPAIEEETEEESPQPASFAEEQPLIAVNESEEDSEPFGLIGPEEQGEETLGLLEDSTETKEDETLSAVAPETDTPNEGPYNRFISPAETLNNNEESSVITFTEPGQRINFRA